MNGTQDLVGEFVSRGGFVESVAAAAYCSAIRRSDWGAGFIEVLERVEERKVTRMWAMDAKQPLSQGERKGKMRLQR